MSRVEHDPDRTAITIVIAHWVRGRMSGNA
jgi:hypothetical protein